MAHIKHVSREAPAKAIINLWVASLIPGWPATFIDLWNILYQALVATPASKVFGS